MSLFRTRDFVRALAVCGVGLGLSGCATKGFVRQQIASSEARLQPAAEEAAKAARDAQALARTSDERAQQALREVQMARELALGNVKREEVRAVVVNFAFDKTDLTIEMKSALDAVAADLAANVNYYALLCGYTDATGTDSYNVGLAERRAGAVQRYLGEKLGPDFARLSRIGYGNSSPVADNGTKEGRARNRRVEVSIVKPVPAGGGEGTAPTVSR